MRILIVEDDLISRNMLHQILSGLGQCDIAVDGKEAVDAFQQAWNASAPYDLICMDIMMPGLNGHEALDQIRGIETQMEIPKNTEVKVIMTTASDDKRNVSDALFKGGASAYFVKPVDPDKLTDELRILGLLDR